MSKKDDKREKRDGKQAKAKGAAKKRRIKKEAQEDVRPKDVASRPAAPSALDVVKYVLPIASVVAAFVVAVLLYRRLLPPAPTPDETVVQAQDVQAAPAETNVYAGVEDKWLTEGLFTTGSQELDQQVKQFCDALTVEGASASDNARKAFDTIAWCTYEERAGGEKPMGTDWDSVAASHFFSTGDPASGVGGSGDEYEFCAAVADCLRYFGYTDALAVPVATDGDYTGQDYGALVLVTDENGRACVCNPMLAANGWMLDRSLYNVVVDNIGQNMEPIEAMGLQVEAEPEDETSSTSASSDTSSSSADTSTDADTYGTDTYGTDTYGTDTYGY